MMEEHHTPSLLGDEHLNGRPQDMRLRLNTPQLNRLRYLLGIEIGRYVDAKQFPDVYEGEWPYLVVDDVIADREELIDPVTIVVGGRLKRVLRTADQPELDEVLDLKAQVDNLWSGGDKVTGDYSHRNIESVTSVGPLCEECGEEEHETDVCPHLLAMVEHDMDESEGFGYWPGEDHR